MKFSLLVHFYVNFQKCHRNLTLNAKRTPKESQVIQ